MYSRTDSGEPAKATPPRRVGARVVAVVMAENDLGDGREIDPEGFGISQYGVGILAGVEEEAAPVDLDESGEAPLSDAGFQQHRRKDLHFDLKDGRPIETLPALDGEARCLVGVGALELPGDPQVPAEQLRLLR